MLLKQVDQHVLSCSRLSSVFVYAERTPADPGVPRVYPTETAPATLYKMEFAKKSLFNFNTNINANSDLIGQKLVENVKILKFKWDILS